VVLISNSCQPDTRLSDHADGASESCIVPVYAQLLLVLSVPTQGGMARLSWLVWLVTYQNGLSICRFVCPSADHHLFKYWLGLMSFISMLMRLKTLLMTLCAS